LDASDPAQISLLHLISYSPYNSALVWSSGRPQVLIRECKTFTEKWLVSSQSSPGFVKTSVVLEVWKTFAV